MLGFINTTLMWALAATALPLLIHLLTRRKLKVVAVSTIAFIKRLERENLRRLKIRQMLLLLLRMLIIALLVLAFARPTIRGNHAALAQRARATAVIIVDNSLSMSAAPDGIEHFEQARRAAREIARIFSAGDELFLVTASKPAAVVPGSPFLESDKFVEVLASLAATWKQTDLQGAVLLAHDILEASRNLNRELFVLTDGRDETLQPVAALAGVRGYSIRYDQALSNNLTLASAAVENRIFERGKSFEVIATVVNESESAQTGHLVHLYLNGKRVAQQSVDVPPGTQRRVALRALADTTGFLEGRIVLADDDFVLDNEQHFTIYIAPERRLLAVSEAAVDLLFIRAALQVETKNQNRQGAAVSWREVRTAQLNAENFNQFDGIILSNVKRIPPGAAERLRDFVENGGGLMLLPGSEADLRHYNETVLTPMQLGAFGETMGSLTTTQNFIKLGQIDFSHPLFDGVFESDAKAPLLDSPLFWFAAQFRPEAGTRVIMRYANEYPFLVERRVGKGRVLLFTSTTEQSWSDLSFKGIFAPLIHRSMIYIAQSRDYLQQPAYIGDELTASLTNRESDLSVSLPTGDQQKTAVHVTGQHYQIRFPETNVPGFYHLLGGERPLYTWAVNFQATELTAAPVAPEMLQAAAGAESMLELPPHGDLAKEIEQARYGTELWRYFLLAALLAMAIEMVLCRSPHNASNGNASSSGVRRGMTSETVGVGS